MQKHFDWTRKPRCNIVVEIAFLGHGVSLIHVCILILDWSRYCLLCYYCCRGEDPLGNILNVSRFLCSNLSKKYLGTEHIFTCIYTAFFISRHVASPTALSPFTLHHSTLIFTPLPQITYAHRLGAVVVR